MIAPESGGPRILVLGAGGVGGYFGGRLAQSGADVTFLVRPGRRDQIQRDGLRITSPLGDLALPVKTVVAGGLTPSYDLVILTCKAYDLDSSIDAIAPAMQGACTVLPLLNGLSHLERLDARFGPAHVLGGSCGIDVMLLPDGVIRHSGTLQRLVFGERDGRTSPRTLAFADLLAKSTIEWEHTDAVLLRMWEKLVFLSALAATTCLFRGNVREIMAAPGGRAAVERALAANVAIATREGYRRGAAAGSRPADRSERPVERVDDARHGGRASRRSRPHHRVDARGSAPARRGRFDPLARVDASEDLRATARRGTAAHGALTGHSTNNPNLQPPIPNQPPTSNPRPTSNFQSLCSAGSASLCRVMKWGAASRGTRANQRRSP
jgi:2-dehydropantoate 2-reductase